MMWLAVWFAFCVGFVAGAWWRGSVAARKAQHRALHEHLDQEHDADDGRPWI